MEFSRQLSISEQDILSLIRDTPDSVLSMEGRAGTALRNYLALTYFPDAAFGGTDLDEIELFYNRYYWFLKAVRTFQRDHGPDAGMEQQAFQLLENAGGDVDWTVVEKIEQQVEIELSSERR